MRQLFGLGRWEDGPSSDQGIAEPAHEDLRWGESLHATADLGENYQLLQPADYGADRLAALSPALASDAAHNYPFSLI